MISEFAISALQQKSDEIQNVEQVMVQSKDNDMDLTGGFADTPSPMESLSSISQISESYLERILLTVPPDATRADSFTISLNSTELKSCSRKFQIINREDRKITWAMKQIGSIKVKRDFDSYSIPDNIFKLDCFKGILEPGASKIVNLSFTPIFGATYTVLFQFRSNGYVMDLEIEGFAQQTEASKPIGRSSPKVEAIDVLNAQSQSSSKSSNTIRNDSPYSTKNEFRHTIGTLPAKLDIPIIRKTASFNKSSPSTRTDGALGNQSDYDELDKSIGNFMMSPSTLKKSPLIENSRKSIAKADYEKLYSLALTPKREMYTLPLMLASPTYTEKTRLDDLIDFGNVLRSASKTIQIKVNNVDLRNVQVHFAVTGPLSIPIREMMMTARSYVILPLLLKSFDKGPINERLLIRKNDKVKRIHIVGQII